MSGTVAMKARLETQGVSFLKKNDVWVAVYAGAQATRDLRRGDCVWKAAYALGEAQ